MRLVEILFRLLEIAPKGGQVSVAQGPLCDPEFLLRSQQIVDGRCPLVYRGQVFCALLQVSGKNRCRRSRWGGPLEATLSSMGRYAAD